MDLSEHRGAIRSVVYIGPDTSEAVACEGLEKTGWRVFPAQDAADAGQVVANRDINVGIVQFSQHAIEDTRQPIENLLSETSRVRWVGLVEPPLLDDLRVRKLISSYLYDYHTLPTNIEHLSSTLGHAHGMASIDTSEKSGHAPPGDSPMVANSAVMRVVSRNIRKIAQTDAPAILTGESGTGKELAARAIHEQSSRAGKPFVAVNCGALAASLIQSELFGHEKGAFTGAHRERIGRIEAADGGTIFLDEIGDLSLDLQVNLLRFLQEGTIERVGRAKPISVDVRVLAATYVDLHEAVKQGKFREDLYYRLNVLKLELPPLRDRIGDIEQLAAHYFGVFSKERNKRISGFTGSALQAMNAYAWPGNVRELINRIRRGVAMCDRAQITAADLGLDHFETEGSIKTLAEVRAESEKRAIQQALQRARHNISMAARELDISRLTLYRLIEKYGMSREGLGAAD